MIVDILESLGLLPTMVIVGCCVALLGIGLWHTRWLIRRRITRKRYLRFLASSGNLTSGTTKIYGVEK